MTRTRTPGAICASLLISAGVTGEFVTVLLEGVEPVEVLAIPRSAVLSDQQGDYVLTVGADDKVAQHRIQLGQSTPTIAAVISGLAAGDKVIVGVCSGFGPASPFRRDRRAR